ncbi:MAG: hypothetical protein ABJH01_05490 [Algoriphagus sp.]|uniref:hypothetical protein n=1 Tax=Algoriphagus sp. TaxID=1872435 RepID=UPI003296A16D
MIIKIILLRDYKFEFVELSKVVIVALVVAKAVLKLAYVQFSFTKNPQLLLTS